MIKRIFILLMGFLCFHSVRSQSLPTGQETRYNPITTAVPFLNITPDSRHGAMGDAGVATSPDVNSQHWNAAKYVFTEQPYAFSLTYTPWLRELVNDINLAYLSGFYRLDGEQTLGASLRYFKMGGVMLTDGVGTNLAEVSPNEFAFDMSYSRKLSERWSGGVTLRYIRSDLSAGMGSESYVPGNAMATDISFYYQHHWGGETQQQAFSAGVNLSNIGSKISYDDGITNEFLPANMKLGVGYGKTINALHSLNFAFDLNKLMVPSPGSRIITDGEDGIIVLPGNRSNETVIGALFSSFGDATDGFSEELKEFSTSLGVEYWYNQQFAIRTGFFNESEQRGNRKFLTAGLGVKMKLCAIDFSYLIAVKQNSPLANTIRFTLTMDSESFKKALQE